MSDSITRLPDGRIVSLHDDARERLCVGVLVLDPVTVADNPEVTLATTELGRKMKARYEGLQPSLIGGLAEARTLYKSFSMDPSRHRPSSEALLRRVLKDKSLYQISNVVDSCNLSSLDFLLPVGMYDLALIKDDVQLRQGGTGDEYPGIRKAMVHLDGRLGLFDSLGPFGSPTSDSARTCTSDSTTSILALIMATGSFSQSVMEKNITTFSENFNKYCHATETFRAILGGV
jgi:DNA/RNA-binding domain of Phe-tRNA-synthetase-like protein